MLCFMDMTFCTFYENCRDQADCPRPLTPEVKLKAKRWWNDKEGAPIAQFGDKPPCHKEQTFKEGVQELASKLERVPKEIREMSGVPSAIKKEEK